MRPVFEVAHQMGLVPMAWASSLRAARRIDARWLWLATAFAVSWVADWLSHRLGTFPVGPPYLVLQAGLIVWTLAPRDDARRFLALLVSTGAFAMTALDPQQPDVLVHTIAWLGLLGILWPLPLIPALRWTFGVAFGLGWLTWLGYCLWPGWPSWLTYQAVRAASVGLFCYAAWHPEPCASAPA
jgi:hypothetical protein